MNSTLTDGLSIMLIGMGTVLCFLCILIFSMYIMSAVVKYLNKLFPEVTAATSSVKTNNDDCIALAVAAAFNRK